MQTVVLAIQVISCIVLVVVVLMQAGKEGMGVIFGGGSSSMFGGGGAGGLLVRITVVAAIVFLGSTVFYNALISKPKVEESVVITSIEGNVETRPAVKDTGVKIEDSPANAAMANASGAKPGSPEAMLSGAASADVSANASNASGMGHANASSDKTGNASSVNSTKTRNETAGNSSSKAAKASGQTNRTTPAHGEVNNKTK